jgi:hypothetical protein
MQKEKWSDCDNGGNPSRPEIVQMFLDAITSHTLAPDEIYAYVFLKNKRAHFMTLPAPAGEIRTEMGARLRKTDVLNLDLSKRGKGVVRVHFYEEY